MHQVTPLARRLRSGSRIGLRLVAAVCAAAAAAGCGVTPTIPGLPPYRMEVQQGNYVSQEMVAQLKPGMTRDQVRFVLGTPLVTDIFHADRWDYVYFREPPGKPREQRRLSVFFEKDRLVRLAGDVVPAAPATEGDAPAVAPAKPSAPAKPAADAKPAPKPEPVNPEPPRQNWSTASDQPEPKPAPAPPPPSAEPAAKPAAGPAGERGFFGRMLDRLKGSE